MGGNALSCKSVRLTKNDYNRVAGDCVAKLREFYPGKRIEALGSYRSKADFGDCDILVESCEAYDPHAAAAALGAKEVVRNGPVTSVGVLVNPDLPFGNGNVFQVDLITMAPVEFDFALRYFGHGDTGNLLGRIAHAQGVSLRHDGLVYIFRDDGHKFREIFLTRDYAQALQFMGYDPNVLARGFETKEDVYRYVATSPFFNRDIFLLENRNAKSRVRDAKRVMYMEFLEWSEANPGLTAFVYPENKAEWLPRIVEFFPGFKAEYDQAWDDLAKLRNVKSKFNGELVAELTGLQGKALGELMKCFKNSFDSQEAQHAFVLNTSLADLEARVRQVQAEMAAQKA